MECVNLKQEFGDRYKVEYEESYYTERTRRTVEDPWLMIIPCQHGHICPWGDSLLAACTNFAGRIAKRVRELSFVTVAQDGDDGINATFDVKHFDEVAEIMKPRRRRRLSETQKQECVDRLQKYWPAKGEAAHRAAAQHAGTAQECDPGVDPV